jgi:hypothetical protein
MRNILPRDILDLFKKDLWKDQRLLETGTIDGRMCLHKYFSSKAELKRELDVIEHLSSILSVARVPEILDSSPEYITYDYIRGIRVFNLFVELDQVDPLLHEQAIQLKRHILARCEDNEKEIQAALIAYPHKNECKEYQAGDKVSTIMQILAYTTGIIINWESLSTELDTLSEIWKDKSTVPFRDATTKNMVLAVPTLWLGSFDSEEMRRKYLVDTIRTGGAAKWLDAPIYDFDFSSCVNASTLEDDPISLKFHERTWFGPPRSAAELVWHGTPDELRAACTFIVRYYRFGGRKAAYRLLHPWGHRIRFRHDNDLFYFSRLPSIVHGLSREATIKFHEILSFTETIARSLTGVRPTVDQFMAAGLAERRRYYVDMYPE